MRIDEIRVYDPRNDGVNYDMYKEFCRRYGKLCPEAVPIFRTGLFQRMSASEVDGGKTLHDHLYGENGFFDSNPEVREAVFVNGELHRFYRIHDQEPDLEHLLHEIQAIPFSFRRPVKLG